MTHPNFDLGRINNCLDGVNRFLKGKKATVALTLGSGLGGFGSDFKGAMEIKYSDVGLLKCAAAGHAGVLRFVPMGQQGVLIFDGRVHLYEGHSFEDIVLAARTATLAGVKTHIITCACGGINERFKPGDLAAIADHINLMGGSPLEGENKDETGQRYPDMSRPYDPELRQIAMAAGRKLGKNIQEGVLAAMRGPQYETPSEIGMLKVLGADMVGMSTVPEVIALRHLNTRVLGLACVTNFAAGIGGESLSHAEVIETGRKTAKVFRSLLTETINMLPVSD